MAERLVAQAAGSPVTVVGWSMGAAVALASSSPLIRRVVLVSPGGLIRLKTPPVVLAASVRWIVGKREADAARLLRLMHASGREPRPLLVQWMTLVAHHVRSSRDPGVARVAVLDREYRAIGGEQDRFLPPARLRIALRHALDVDLTTVPSGGHLLAEEQADVVARFAVPWAHVGDAGAE